ncbi:hypothetical protein E4T43_03560 [Aureobasidium subglaciale]|nr:hypothetical protein E4T43_03560 [Aureobasidium subglaciale]
MPPQQLRHASQNPDLDAVRRAALRRLDQHIKPDDLSATLEAHRESNRASIIKKIPTRESDPDMMRPSYIERLKYKRKVSHEKAKDERTDMSTLAHFKRVVREAATKQVDDLDTLELQRIEAALESAPSLRELERQRQNNEELHLRRVDFLRKHEEPFEKPPRYDVTDRTTFFAVIRRSAQLVQAEQKKYATLHFLEAFASRSLLAYYGIPQPIIPTLKGYAHPEPWNRRPQTKTFTNEHWADLEIRLFAEWMEPTLSEKAARRKVAGTLVDLVKQTNPALMATPFGSQATGLTMPSSDIDIRVADPTYKQEPDDTTRVTRDALAKMTLAERQELRQASHLIRTTAKRKHMVLQLRELQSALADHEDFDNVQFLEARVPLIKAIHKPTGLKVQMVSTSSTHRSQEAIKNYLAEFPHLKALFMLLKTALNLRNMSDPWNGGFGSYTLFMMCVAGLRYAATKRVQGYDGPGRISDNLIQILTFWSEFKTNTKAIILEPTKIVPKRVKPSPEEIEARKTDTSLWARLRIAQPNAYRPYMLHLQDPADPYNDLGRSSLAIKDLQKTFVQLLVELTRDLKDPKRRDDAAPLLKSVVGRCDRYFDEMRIPVDLWGEQFVEEMQAAEAEEAEAEAERQRAESAETERQRAESAETERQRAESAVEDDETEEGTVGESGAVGESGVEETSPQESAFRISRVPWEKRRS